MKLSDIMTPHVETVDKNDSIRSAAEKMDSLNVGILPVTDKGGLIGVITDRDIVIRSVAGGLDPQGTLVGQIMTSEVDYAFEDTDLSDAAKMMEEKQIRRLLILDHDKNLVGILSLGDLAVRGHNEPLTEEVLEKVSEPAVPTR